MRSRVKNRKLQEVLREHRKPREVRKLREVRRLQQVLQEHSKRRIGSGRSLTLGLANQHRESPIDLGDTSGDEPRYTTRSRGKAAGKNASESVTNSQATKKPSTHKGSKNKAGTSKESNSTVSKATEFISLYEKEAKNEDAIKGKKFSKKEKKWIRMSKRREVDPVRLPSEVARADSFKAAHPAVDCPDYLSKDRFKELMKRHGGNGGSS